MSFNLSYKEANIIHSIKSLKIDDKGRYYYYVPTSVRRNSRKLVSAASIRRLIKLGAIKESELPKK